MVTLSFVEPFLTTCAVPFIPEGGSVVISTLLTSNIILIYYHVHLIL